MTTTEIAERFAKKAPVAVMIRGLLDFAFAPDFVNPIAERFRSSTYTRDIEFAHLIALLSDVVFRVHPSVRAAYRNNDHCRAVAGLKCFYEKLQHVEPAVIAGWVAAVADRVAPLVGHPVSAEPVRGFRLRMLDGNHSAPTDRRSDGLEDVPAPLPGQALVVRDFASGLLSRLLACADAHTNERALLDDVLPWFAAGDCVVADCNFCTEDFLTGRVKRGASFVVRHHGSVGLQMVGERRRAGASPTGEIHEYGAKYAQTDGVVRVVETALTTPTQSGQTIIRVLTDLTQKQADAMAVASVYLERRTIETAFQELEAGLQSEVSTLAYPRAALFAFGVAVAVYNLLQVVRTTVERQRARGRCQALSGTLMSQEVRSFWAGLGVALDGAPGFPAGDWTAGQMREWLAAWSASMDLTRYAKSVRGPKKPRPLPRHVSKTHHGSTHRVLQRRKEAPKKTP